MGKVLNALTTAVAFVNSNILWGIPMILMIFGTGVFLTVRTRGLQFRRFGVSLSTTIVPAVKDAFAKKNTEKKTKKPKGSVSQFEAFAAAISGTVGTGNIVGVAGALISGGPGAVFWMWVSALFGLVTNYSENVLGLYFRRRDAEGGFSGGPMYYIARGLKCKWLAKTFAFCCTLAAVGMAMVQVNTISGTIQTAVTDNAKTQTVVAWIVGIAVAALTAVIVIGGIRRIGRVASMIVPFMALLFIVMALIIIFMNIAAVPAAFASIFVSAFSARSVAGGFFGYMIMRSMRYGFARGIFSNEAGLGSSVIAHSASETKEPVKQGLWGVFEVFLDTFVICTLTALSLICTGVYDFTNIAANDGVLSKASVASSAFTDTFGHFGMVVFAVILPLFAFTTVLAWSYYGQKSAEYLFEKNTKVSGMVFRVIYVLLILVGAVTASDFVWELDDMFNALMAIPNLIALICLSGLIVRISKNYFDRRSGKDVKPMLSAYDDLNEEFAEQITSDNS